MTKTSKTNNVKESKSSGSPCEQNKSITVKLEYSVVTIKKEAKIEADGFVNVDNYWKKHKNGRQDLYFAFIDLAKAFDTVNREMLWKIMTKCGCPSKFMAIIRAFHQALKSKTKVRTTYIFDLQYADDAAYPAPTQQALQRNITDTNDAYRTGGMLVNTDKTELEPEIQNRIRQSTVSFGKLRERVYTNRDLTVKTKVKVYVAICLPILLYGSESWTLYSKQIRRLEAFHIRCLQCILGITWRNRLPHVDILQTANTTSIEHRVNDI
ncbi:uncharacterized protein LOC143037716 [Oratosquilla oratoria]|uniref:uncharacterized protein LOC143037716 n=1 Tax=Oratosquilla oratoria TaxID=337810 RepID=UPI003F760189